MSDLSLTMVISSIIVIVVTVFLAKNVFVILFQGRLIVKTEEIQFAAIFWTIILIINVYLLYKNIVSYHQYKYEEVFITNILGNIGIIELMIISILRTIWSYEIRERGISNYGSFYKWTKVKSYEWVSKYEIQFKVKTIFNPNRIVKFRIFEDEIKAKVDEILKRNIL
ncbi:hypothetical protein IAI10_09330 [Clostridium sp. 19966]|uniref:hypothetical protein n=1 Tax=Clostridium sp. 19966 TaxID=2768166 RepID=UPI0028E09ADC|nr:hypothetical protein [Clostridium sp. 19966]MDT8716859.1 hypothetical protein [Clostridium sp. 19966]